MHCLLDFCCTERPTMQKSSCNTAPRESDPMQSRSRCHSCPPLIVVAKCSDQLTRERSCQGLHLCIICFSRPELDDSKVCDVLQVRKKRDFVVGVARRLCWLLRGCV